MRRNRRRKEAEKSAISGFVHLLWQILWKSVIVKEAGSGGEAAET